MSRSPEQVWVDNWREAGPVLEAIKCRELRAMTPERALLAADAVLDMASHGWWNPAREAWSGLVEQQALFARLRSK